MNEQTNDDNNDNNETQIRRCTYCEKRLTKRWNNRANGSNKYIDWDTRPMHGTCYKKDREDTLHKLAMKNYLEEKAAAQQKHKQEQQFQQVMTSFSDSNHDRLTQELKQREALGLTPPANNTRTTKINIANDD